jgi:NAD(P)-dependent dehydrogenase (short-subunit alcohol dehydrogenase family)
MSKILIIGGSSGIGKQLSSDLAASEHHVYSTYNKTTVQVETPGPEFHPLDVMDENINLDFLPESIDGLVYCPGSINLKPFARIKPQSFIEDLNLQVIGAIKVIQAVLPKLKRSDHASIVLFSTVAVQMGFNFHSQVSVSKGAIEGLVRSLSAEFAPNIRVNGIAPSLTDTPLASQLLSSAEKKEANAQRHPLKRIGNPKDISAIASFLLSKDSSWITGQIIHVDGGMSSIKS